MPISLLFQLYGPYQVWDYHHSYNKSRYMLFDMQLVWAIATARDIIAIISLFLSMRSQKRYYVHNCVVSVNRLYIKQWMTDFAWLLTIFPDFKYLLSNTQKPDKYFKGSPRFFCKRWVSKRGLCYCTVYSHSHISARKTLFCKTIQSLCCGGSYNSDVRE